MTKSLSIFMTSQDKSGKILQIFWGIRVSQVAIGPEKSETHYYQ